MNPNSSDDINRIIIGLGGQGSRVVNEVRKAVMEQGGGSLPLGLEFIAIDSDRIALQQLDSVPEPHRIHLAAPDDNITETVVPWLPHEFRPKAGGGCGMQRLTGKAMYLVHRHRIAETVREVARKLRQRTQVSNFMVVVVNAAGGGTGSGMLIDFSIDLRADLKEITGQDPLLFGVGILPSRSETIQRANGVALLKELHFLLSHKTPIMVGGRDLSNPFELFFLVGREVMGIERDDEVMRSIIRFTIDLGLIPSNSRENAAAGKGAGWVDLQDIRTLVKGAGHMFSTFGYYSAMFPADKLAEYFASLDKLEALRKEMPSHVSDLESAKRGLEDKRIALAHLEELLKLALARAQRLRNDGVLGMNRPELAKFLADIGRLEDEIKKLRREIAQMEEMLPGAAGRRATIERELKDAQVRAEELKALLLAPVQSRTQYVVPLSEEELVFLAQNRHLLETGHFKSVMEALTRLPDYHDRTMEVVGKNKILYLPLINYRMAFHTASMFPAPVVSALRKHGFVRFDAQGNPVVADDHLWMIMAMLTSKPENVDATKVSARAFKEVVEGHIARRAEVKIVPSSAKRWEVVVHSWMVGIQIAPVAPGYPPRLRELEWLAPEYEQVAREGGLTQHHAFLFGDPVAFGQMTSVPLDRASVERTNQLVTEFWAKYAPIDAQARWTQVAPVLAESAVAAEELAKTTGALADAIDEFRTSRPGFTAVERFGTALAQATEKVDAFARRYAEDAHPLRERIATVAEQAERARVGPRDPETLLPMEELAAEAHVSAATAAEELARLRNDLPELVRTTIADARATPPEGDGSTRSTVRWEHALGQLEARIAHLHASSGTTAEHLRALGATLQRVQEQLRARAIPGGSLPRLRPPLQSALEAVAPAHTPTHAHPVPHPHPRPHEPAQGHNGHHDPLEEIE